MDAGEEKAEPEYTQEELLEEETISAQKGGGTTSLNTTRWIHGSTAQFKEVIFKCDHCEANFRNNSALYKHINETHTNKINL